jgi:hypothetical protein
VDPVPYPLPLRKSGNTRNRIRDLWVSSQKLWLLDRRGRSENANTLNIYFYSVFRCERSIPQIQHATSREPFAGNTKIIKKRLAAIGKNKSVGREGISGDILKQGGEALIPHLARLLDVTVNNAAIPSDWKKATVIPIYMVDDRSEISNYRPVSLTSVVC